MSCWHSGSLLYYELILLTNKQRTRKENESMNGLTRWQRPEMAIWSGFGRLTDLRDEIDRLFEAPLAEFTQATQLLSGWTPAMDLYEDKDNLYVRAELPGMKKEEIDLTLHDGSLSISGERKQEKTLADAEVY